MASPTIVQGAAGVSDTPTSLTNTVTLSGGATAGNLIVFLLAGDKNTGSITMTGTGWTTTFSLPSTSVSLYVTWKVADGGETALIATTGGAPLTGNTAYAYELAQTGSSAWTVLGSASTITTEANITTSSTGTTAAITADGLAIAAMAVDTAGNVTSGSWSGGYTTQYDAPNTSGTGGGAGGIHTAYLARSTGNTAGSTWTNGVGVGDQQSAAVAVFGRTSVISSVTGSSTASSTVTALRTDSGAVAGTSTASSTVTALRTDSAALSGTVTASATVAASRTDFASVDGTSTASAVVTGEETPPITVQVSAVATASAYIRAVIGFYFRTPSVRERPYIRHPLWSRTYIDRGITLLKFGTSYQQYSNVDPALLDTADVIYLGGHLYFIDPIEAAALTAAGYGAWIADDLSDPVPDIDYSQYGAGFYGSGPYGD